jgi:hypothetical protein
MCVLNKYISSSARPFSPLLGFRPARSSLAVAIASLRLACSSWTRAAAHAELPCARSPASNLDAHAPLLAGVPSSPDRGASIPRRWRRVWDPAHCRGRRQIVGVAQPRQAVVLDVQE